MNTRSRTGTVEYLVAQKRLKNWTRQRFALPVDAAVLVQESCCELPGFPPSQTLTTFWTTPESRHQFTVFKPVEEVAEVDLPPVWMKDAMLINTDADCGCC